MSDYPIRWRLGSWLTAHAIAGPDGVVYTAIVVSRPSVTVFFWQSQVDLHTNRWWLAFGFPLERPSVRSVNVPYPARRVACGPFALGVAR